jgi:ABC-type nitrate/sulfonate/bicarbonate transport system permease component
MSDAIMSGTQIGAGSGVRAFLLRNPSATQLGVVVLALALWELAGRTAIVAAMPRVLGDPGVRNALVASFLELATAFVLAVVIGLAVGLAIGLSGFARRATLPLVLLLYSIPQVTILPLFVLYFGIGAGARSPSA